MPLIRETVRTDCPQVKQAGLLLHATHPHDALPHPCYGQSKSEAGLNLTHFDSFWFILAESFMLPLRPTPQPTEQARSRMRGSPPWQGTTARLIPRFLRNLLISVAISPLARAVVQEWPGVEDPHTSARFGPIHSQWRGSRWGQCDLVRSACTRERGPESLRWPWLASSQVARRGKLLFRLHLVAFRCISHRHRGPGAGDARFPPAWERRGPLRG